MLALEIKMQATTSIGRQDDAAAPGSPRTRAEEMELAVEQIRARRDSATTLREMAEWCVAYEELIGGRPPAG
jgi:hypothetical protein